LYEKTEAIALAPSGLMVGWLAARGNSANSIIF